MSVLHYSVLRVYFVLASKSIFFSVYSFFLHCDVAKRQPRELIGFLLLSFINENVH